MSGTLLAEWIDVERTARGHSMATAAHACGISELTLMRCREAGRQLTARVRAGLAGYLRVPKAMVETLQRVERSNGQATFRVLRSTRERLTLLGQLLENERRARGETMEQAAETMVIHVVSVLSVKKGMHTLRPRTLAAVARYVGVPTDLAAELAQRPAGEQLPVETFVGWKLHPTVRPYAAGRGNVSCDECVFRSACEVDVERGDFAWCEELSPVDVVAGEPEREVTYEGW